MADCLFLRTQSLIQPGLLLLQTNLCNKECEEQEISRVRLLVI